MTTFTEAFAASLPLADDPQHSRGCPSFLGYACDCVAGTITALVGQVEQARRWATHLEGENAESAAIVQRVIHALDTEDALFGGSAAIRGVLARIRLAVAGGA